MNVYHLQLPGYVIAKFRRKMIKEAEDEALTLIARILNPSGDGTFDPAATGLGPSEEQQSVITTNSQISEKALHAIEHLAQVIIPDFSVNRYIVSRRHEFGLNDYAELVACHEMLELIERMVTLKQAALELMRGDPKGLPRMIFNALHDYLDSVKAIERAGATLGPGGI